MTRLEALHLDRARINAQLDTNPFITCTSEEMLLDELASVCDAIDQIEMTEAERSVKRFMDRNSVPF